MKVKETIAKTEARARELEAKAREQFVVVDTKSDTLLEKVVASKNSALIILTYSLVIAVVSFALGWAIKG